MKKFLFIYVFASILLVFAACKSRQQAAVPAPIKNTKGFEDKSVSDISPPTNQKSFVDFGLNEAQVSPEVLAQRRATETQARLAQLQAEDKLKKAELATMTNATPPPAVMRLETVPPVYETVTEQVPDAAGGYKTVTKQVIKETAQVKEVPTNGGAVPAEYATVTNTVIVNGKATVITQQPTNSLVEGNQNLFGVKGNVTIGDISGESPAPSNSPIHVSADTINVEATTEKYEPFIENEFLSVAENAFSTFSIDADGAAYSNLKRYVLDYHQKPPLNSIRLEEFINYFSYEYPNPANHKPIFVDGEISSCPWDMNHKLVRIGFKGKNYDKQQRPASNFVFLVDVSGSMSEELPLVIKSLELLVNELNPNDKVAIVTYAGAERLELDATPVSQKETILKHLKNLKQGGSTNGAKGIVTAYEIAQKNFVPNANNRVVLVTDGDFNVGISSRQDLINLIEKQRETGVFLSVIGCGTGNYNDQALEALADHGNGIYEYLNKFEDGQKIFVEEFDKFFTVAKDVKIQIEFNPELVSAYRLIGYENRKLNKEDFTDDKKDAGDLSAGQSLTALYEIIPAQRTSTGKGGNLQSLQINFRYKEPQDATSQLISIDVIDKGTPFEGASENMRFAASVVSFGMLLRDSKFKGITSYEKVRNWADNARNYDVNGYRAEFLKVIDAVTALPK